MQFSGGLELLFDRVKSQKIFLTHSNSVPSTTITVPASQSTASDLSAVSVPKADTDAPFTIQTVLSYLILHKLRDRPDLFVLDGNVRPGILVLVNDCDWELLDGLDAKLKSGDVVTFISTLHGG